MVVIRIFSLQKCIEMEKSREREEWQKKKKPPSFQLGHRLRNQPAMRLGKVGDFFFLFNISMEQS
jgi:hypothetical protein